MMLSFDGEFGGFRFALICEAVYQTSRRFGADWPRDEWFAIALDRGFLVVYPS